MLEFRKLKLEDSEIIRDYFERCASHSCDMTMGTALMWREYFEAEIAESGDDVVYKVKYTEDGGYAFLFPYGERTAEICREIDEYCEKNKIKLCYYSVTDDRLPALLEIYPDAEYYPERKWADYLYEADKIKNLTGKKYSAQRNHINKFRRMYEDFTFEEITENDVAECIDLVENRMEQKESEFAQSEESHVREVLENPGVYRMLTGVMRIDGVVAGFSCGEKTGDMLTVHIEKADTAFEGVYAMLTHLFLEKYADESIKIINREDDAGDEGLRKSKLSYNPCELLTKNFVTINK